MKLIITVLTRITLVSMVSCVFIDCSVADKISDNGMDVRDGSQSKFFDKVSTAAFANPPVENRPGAFWPWLNGKMGTRMKL